MLHPTECEMNEYEVLNDFSVTADVSGFMFITTAS